MKNHLMPLSLLALMAYQSTYAVESDLKTLGNVVNLTDVYKIKCATGTTRLDFQLKDATSAGLASAPQLINAHLTKSTAKADALSITAGSSKELTLKANNGMYKLTLDTIGTNSTIKTAQSYVVQYQCLNSAGKSTTPKSGTFKAGIDSAVKTIKNATTASLSFTCNKDSKLGNTEKLLIKITNKTVLPKTTTTVNNNNISLAAQVYKLVPQNNDPKTVYAANALDLNPSDNNFGDKISLTRGSGDYSVIVDTTAINNDQDNTKKYSFQYGCLNDANVEQKATLSQVEDH